MLQYGQQIFVLQSAWLAGISQILDHFIVYRLNIYSRIFGEREIIHMLVYHSENLTLTDYTYLEFQPYMIHGGPPQGTCLPWVVHIEDNDVTTLKAK